MTELIIKDGIPHVKVGNHQIFQEPSNERHFVLEKFEFVENGTNMYSVHDSYADLETAIRVAKTLK